MPDFANDKEIEDFENEIAAVTGTAQDGIGDGVNPFDGTGEEWSQARRVVRGEYRESDFAVPETDFFQSYQGPTSGASVDFNSPESVTNWVNLQDALGRERFGERWDPLIDKYIGPWVREMQVHDPAALQRLLANDNAYEIAYRAAEEYDKQQRSRVPTKAEMDEAIRTMDGERFGEWLAAYNRDSSTEDEDDTEHQRLSRREMKTMGRVHNPSEFIRQLDAYKRRNGW